jgi:hypothetical protein
MRRTVVGLALLCALLASACGPAIDRPVRGAVPGSQAPTPPGVPPTLQPSEALRFKPLPSPSPAGAPAPVPSPPPAVAPQPSPGVAAQASPSAAPAPPIVRTIAPPANAHLPAGAATTVSAVLVGRGADLASASLAINGADAGAQVDKRSPREWSIHASQALAAGTYTARVLVRDAGGAAGGFTWQFAVGEPEPTAAPTE